MTIATPFDKKAHFYFNQKINCLRAEGRVNYKGIDYTFQKEDSFGVLDWGRGVWTYKNTWYWGSGSGQVAGVPFGFNIGYGFGDTSAATENMLFYAGKAHKLSEVVFNIPTDSNGKDDYLKPWTFTQRRRPFRNGLHTHSGQSLLHKPFYHPVGSASGVWAVHRKGRSG